jgi:ParB-like chromosome segregation protein Spo0J
MTDIHELKTTKYANKVRQLTREQYEALKQDIAEAGRVLVPISINENGDVLDGHHRLRACKELHVEHPPLKVERFANELEEELFVSRINRIRRQLPKFEDIELAFEEQAIRAELARRNMKAGKTLSRNQERVHIDEEVAKLTNSSKDTVHKVKQVLKAAREAPECRLELDYEGRMNSDKPHHTYREVLEDARRGKVTIAVAHMGKLFLHFFCHMLLRRGMRNLNSCQS